MNIFFSVLHENTFLNYDLQDQPVKPTVQTPKPQPAQTTLTVTEPMIFSNTVLIKNKISPKTDKFCTNKDCYFYCKMTKVNNRKQRCNNCCLYSLVRPGRRWNATNDFGEVVAMVDCKANY